MWMPAAESITSVMNCDRSIIEELKSQGALKALAIVSSHVASGSLLASDGSELYEYGGFGSGRWVRKGDLHDGSVLYLGSATHAGHIELKAYAVLIDGSWHSAINV